jgi:hypothetical protein
MNVLPELVGNARTGHWRLNPRSTRSSSSTASRRLEPRLTRRETSSSKEQEPHSQSVSTERRLTSSGHYVVEFESRALTYTVA